MIARVARFALSVGRRLRERPAFLALRPAPFGARELLARLVLELICGSARGAMVVLAARCLAHTRLAVARYLGLRPFTTPGSARHCLLEILVAQVAARALVVARPELLALAALALGPRAQRALIVGT